MQRGPAARKKIMGSSIAAPIRTFLMSGSDDYLLIVLARDIEDFERIHRTELSRLPHVSRVQSNFALREIIDRAVPPAIFGRPGRQSRKQVGKAD
jgi:Lrp/AsnC family leucine-responsive transcriptional regulator